MPAPNIESRIIELTAEVNAAVEGRSADVEELRAELRELKIKAARPYGAIPTYGDTNEVAMKAFGDALRTQDPAMLRKAMSIGVDADGGYLVPITIQGAFDTVMTKFNPFRKLCKVQPVNTDKPELLIGQGDAAASWVAETAARAATTSPTIAAITPAMGEVFANVPVTQRLVEDSHYDLAKFVIDEAARKFALAEAAACVSGSGTSQPKGFLTYTLSATPTWGQIRQIKSGSAGAVTHDTLLDLVFALPAAYRQGASFVAAPSALAAIRKLKDSQNQPLWSPGLGAATPPSLFGYPVFESEDMPALGTSSNSIAFADWSRAYVIAERGVQTILVDPYSNKPYVNYYCRRRVGGALYDSNAIAVYTAGV